MKTEPLELVVVKSTTVEVSPLESMVVTVHPVTSEIEPLELVVKVSKVEVGTVEDQAVLRVEMTVITEESVESVVILSVIVSVEPYESVTVVVQTEKDSV